MWSLSVCITVNACINYDCCGFRSSNLIEYEYILYYVICDDEWRKRGRNYRATARVRKQHFCVDDGCCVIFEPNRKYTSNSFGLPSVYVYINGRPTSAGLAGVCSAMRKSGQFAEIHSVAEVTSPTHSKSPFYIHHFPFLFLHTDTSKQQRKM